MIRQQVPEPKHKYQELFKYDRVRVITVENLVEYVFVCAESFENCSLVHCNKEFCKLGGWFWMHTHFNGKPMETLTNTLVLGI